jgi:endonuclease/exonuclease/phosphatase family metal-dependent hydrolase
LSAGLVRFVPFGLALACGGAKGDTAESGLPPPGTLTPPTSENPRIKVATWNLEVLGAEGSAEYEAVVEVLRRLDADVVLLNELELGEDRALDALADALGYPDAYYPSDNPFGTLRNGWLSRLPVLERVEWTSERLSDDARANDQTRLPLELRVQGPSTPVRLIVQHYKSGFEDIDEFRRAVDGQRVGQAVARGAASEPTLVVGDFNADLGDPPETPSRFSAIPSGAPGDYVLGSDLQEVLREAGLPNTNFEPLAEQGLVALDARQADGRIGTREPSERRIDYLFANSAVRAPLTLVYDSRDDDGSTLAQGEGPPDREASRVASDHFPVLCEFEG